MVKSKDKILDRLGNGDIDSRKTKDKKAESVVVYFCNQGAEGACKDDKIRAVFNVYLM